MKIAYGENFDYDDVDNKYYQGVNFKIYMERDGDKFEFGDGFYLAHERKIMTGNLPPIELRRFFD